MPICQICHDSRFSACTVEMPIRGKLANRPSMGCEMIDLDTIEDIDECDGEAVHAYGRSSSTGQWSWCWIPVETLAEAGRDDILHAVGAIADDWGEAA